jgi:MarR family transcriptional regulator, lower aerobic nicotinate degradation pathway regulator
VLTTLSFKSREQSDVRTKRPVSVSESNSGASDAAWRELSLLDRPGFLIRRVYQIHGALFQEECGALDVTPIQYSILTVLAQRGACEQSELSQYVAMDRTNIADVLARLEDRGLVARWTSPNDKRKRIAKLTRDGRAILKRLDQCARRAHERTIEALPPGRRKAFLEDLTRLVNTPVDLENLPPLKP